LRIALWNTGYRQGLGGSEKMANVLASRLHQVGLDTMLIANGEPGREAHNPYFPALPEAVEIYVDTFPNPLLSSRHPIGFIASLWRYAGAALRLRFFLRRRKPDLVHLRFVNIDVFPLVLYKYLFDYRLIVTFVGTDIAVAQRSRVARLKVQIAMRYADAITAVSQQIADSLNSHGGRKKAVCIPNGVDSAEVQTSASRNLPAVAADHFVYCGRLHPVKRVPLLVDIFKRCIDAGCDRNLYIVGDGGEREAVTSLIAHHRLGDRIVMLGALRHCEALAVIARARCLLLASSDEGCPNVVLEAMALGIPVIAPCVGGVPELVTHGETGYLFPPDDPQAAREYILCVARVPHHARMLGQRGNDVVQQRFTLDAMVGKYLELYQQLLGHAQPLTQSAQ